MASINSLLENGYYVDISSYIRTALQRLRQYMGMQVAFGLLGLFIAGSIGAIAGTIPYVGQFIGAGFSMVTMAGFYLFADARRRGESPDFGVFFGGFSRLHLRELFLTGLVAAVITGILMIPIQIEVRSEMEVLQESMRNGDFSNAQEMVQRFIEIFQSLGGVSLYLFFFGIIVALYFTVAYMFAPMLVMFRGMKFWDALESSRRVATRNWGWLFLLVLAVGALLILVMVGIILIGALLSAVSQVLGIALIFISFIVFLGIAMAFTYQVYFAAYEGIFGFEDDGDSFESRISEIGQ